MAEDQNEIDRITSYQLGRRKGWEDMLAVVENIQSHDGVAGLYFKGWSSCLDIINMEIRLFIKKESMAQPFSSDRGVLR